MSSSHIDIQYSINVMRGQVKPAITHYLMAGN